MAFVYSDDLVDRMNKHGVFEPDGAWFAFHDLIDDLVDERVALDKGAVR